jgi:hypothetical protein
VEEIELGLGVVLIEGGDLVIFFLDEFLVGEGLVFKVGLGLLEFFLDQIEILFEVKFGFGELVVLVGFGFEGLGEVALFLL